MAIREVNYKHVATTVPDKVHQQLGQFCREQQVTMRFLMRELLRWGVTQDAETLRRLGLRLPIWPDGSALDTEAVPGNGDADTDTSQ